MHISAPEALLDVRGIEAGYGKIAVLHGVGLRIAPGEVVALLGPNGAGKTTALRALAGLTTLGGGHITLDGRYLDRPDRRVWIPPERRRIGVVFQDYLLFPHLSALDNVAFGPRRHGALRRPGHEGRRPA